MTSTDRALWMLTPPSAPSPAPATVLGWGDAHQMGTNNATTRATTAPTSSYRIRRYRDSDQAAILVLITADRLPGQPEAGPDELRQALAGTSPVDSGWWAELTDLRTDVLLDPNNQPAGVISYARRVRDDTGLILWLHAAENPALIDALIGHARNELTTATRLEAYSFATALGLGLEALPLPQRMTTHAALRAAGFASDDLWCYMRRDLTTPPPAAVTEGLTIDIAATGEQSPKDTTLTARCDGITIGEALIGTPRPGSGVLWWIEITPQARGAGHGRALLTAALRQLHQAGAREVILYVDDDAPGGERDRGRAKHLYRSTGFQQIARLHSYRRSR